MEERKGKEKRDEREKWKKREEEKREEGTSNHEKVCERGQEGRFVMLRKYQKKQ